MKSAWCRGRGGHARAATVSALGMNKRWPPSRTFSDASLNRLTLAGGTMVWLGGPRRRRGSRGSGIYLHDAPPGYSPPPMPLKERQRAARRDFVLMRVAAVVLGLAATAFLVIIVLIIATHV